MMDKVARERSAFFVPGMGLLEWNTMPFGLKTAPALFCRAMSIVMKGLVGRCMGIVMDDFLVHSATFEEHLIHTEAMLKRCREFNLTLEIEKAQILPRDTMYCGHLVGTDGNRPDPRKLDAIGAWPRPTSRRGIRGFVGLAGFYRKYIPNFSRIVRPMTEGMDASQDMKPFIWDRRMEKSFISTKRHLLSENVMLLRPDFDKDFILATDWSKDGFGAVLCQLDSEGALRPLSFASKAKQAKVVDDATQGEAEVVIWALDQFRHYIWGRRIVCYTDHNALIYLFDRLETKSNKIQRWVLRIQQYDVQFRHIRGKFNLVADALSREGSCDAEFQQRTPAERARMHAEAAYQLIYFEDDAEDDDYEALPQSVRDIVVKNPVLHKEQLLAATKAAQSAVVGVGQEDDDLVKVITWSPTVLEDVQAGARAPSLFRGLWKVSTGTVEAVAVEQKFPTFEGMRRHFATGGKYNDIPKEDWRNPGQAEKRWTREHTERPPTADVVITRVEDAAKMKCWRELVAMARDWCWRVGVWTWVIQAHADIIHAGLGTVVHGMQRAGFPYFAILRRDEQVVLVFTKEHALAGKLAISEINFRKDLRNEGGEDLQLRGVCCQVLREIAASKGSKKFRRRRSGPTENYLRRIEEAKAASANCIRPIQPGFHAKEGKDGAVTLQPEGEYPPEFRYMRPETRAAELKLREMKQKREETRALSVVGIMAAPVGNTLDQHDVLILKDDAGPASRSRRAKTNYTQSVEGKAHDWRRAQIDKRKADAAANKAKRDAARKVAMSQRDEIAEAKRHRQEAKEAEKLRKTQERERRAADKAALQPPAAEPAEADESPKEPVKEIGWMEAQRTDPLLRKLYTHIVTHYADEEGNYPVSAHEVINTQPAALQEAVGKEFAGDFRGHLYMMNKFVLYRLDQLNAKAAETDRWLVVVPQIKKREVLYAAHDSKEGGHDGYHKTMKCLSKNFWWHKMSSEVKQYCKECGVCARTKGAINSTHGLSNALLPRHPFEILSIDLHGPYPPSRGQHYTYYLVVVDNLSTYPEIMFLKTAHKEEITLQLLLHVYARYGAPEHVIMDNGANLKNGHVYSVLQMLGLKLADGVPKNDEGVKVNESVVRYTSAYNPQANTHAEFIQSQLIAAMRIMAEENGGDQSLWPYAIVMRLPSLRNKPRVNMTFSAHDMLYKRPLVSNFERITKANLQYVNLEDVGLNAHEDKVVFGGSERVLQAMHDITIMDDITAWELRESTEIRQNIVNTNRKEIVFRVGDLVGLKNNTQSDKSKGVASKMFVTHTGPYVIMNRYGKSYRLRKVDIIENNKTKYATRRVISEDGSSVMIADRNNVKEQVQVGRLIPWRQLRDIQPFRESPQDKMLKNLYTSDEKELLSDHEAKHSEAYKELRKFMEHQWRRGASPEDSRGAYTFFSLKEEDGYTVHYILYLLVSKEYGAVVTKTE